MGRAKPKAPKPERTPQQLEAAAKVARDFFERRGVLLPCWAKDAQLVGMLVHLGVSAVALHAAGVLVPMHLVERERAAAGARP